MSVWERLQPLNLISENTILKYVRKKILRQTDAEIIEIDEQIEQEIEDGTIPDPNAVDPITGEPLPVEGEGGDMGMMGDVPMDAEIDGGITDAQVQKDTKKLRYK